MCSAMNTRLRSTSPWIARQAASSGSNVRPAKIVSSGASTSVFQETTRARLCRSRNVASMRSSRSCQRARTFATSARASSSAEASCSSVGRASLPAAKKRSASGAARNSARRSASLSLLRTDISMLSRSMPSV